MILGVRALGLGDYVELAAPGADVTVGLLDGLDFFIVGAPVFELGPREALLGNDGELDLGFKWQPIRGEHWNASFTPGVGLGFPFGDAPAVLLPLQVEYQRDDFMVGTDFAWVVATDGPDIWFVATYGGYSLTDDLQLLGEFVWLRSPFDFETQLLLNFGLDWTTPTGFNLLASAGPGIEVFEGGEITWRAFFGIQWTFAVWGRR